MTPNEKRKAKLLKRFGSEEAVRQHYRDMQKKSMLNPNKQKGNHTGGFSDKELAKNAGDKGRETQRRLREAKMANLDEGL